VEANLKRRFLTAVIAISLVAGIVGWARPWLFTALILSVTALALHEYFAMALPGYPGEQVVGIVFGMTVSLAMVIPEPVNRQLWFSLLLVLIFAGYLFAKGKLHDKLTRLAWMVLGGLYIGLLMPNWIFVFRFSGGRRWVFFVLGVIVAGDSVAYFIGKRFGVKKLAPEISPGKTVAGAWGYIIGSVAAGTIAARSFLGAYPFWEVTLLALILAGCGQVGDLFESLLKRVFAVKDSGSFMPGHGGLLDRLDSLIFSAVFANAYLRVLHS
jgi:phosphatidate cytidylyltransferase